MPSELVVTLGPASEGKAGALAGAGATAFRLNASHLTPEALGDAVRHAREDAPGTPLVVDLQGAKMRLGLFDERPLGAGERIELTLGGTIPVPHPEIFAEVSPGETLSCDDDRLRLRVIHAGEERLVVEALFAGTLQPRKGINRVEHPVVLTRLTAADRAHLDVLAGAAGAIAFSFMRDGREAAWVREAAPGARVVGKVERLEALAALGSIAAAADSVWICRGDLGAQLGPAALAQFVATFDPRSLGVPVLMAGQVLEHLTRHREPTRSEVCHLHDLLARGYAGIVLSDETAIGDDPVHAVATARSLLDGLAVV